MLTTSIIPKKKGKRLWKMICPFILIIAMLAISLSLATPAVAVDQSLQLDQQMTSVAGYANLPAFSWDQHGQTFTAGLAGNLGKASLYIFCASGGSMTMQIQATTSGMPNGTVMATATVDIPGDFAYRWVDFDFSSPAYVTSGTTYALVFNPFNSVGINDADGYSGGQAVAKFGSWSPSTIAKDFAFRTYVEPAPTYIVTYNGNGNSGGNPPTDSNAYYQGDPVTVAGNTGSLSKADYSFAGWNTAANGSGTSYTGGDTFNMGTADVTLYAQWTENTYSVTYNGNSNTGGSVPVDATSYHNGDMATVIGNTGSLVRTGYTFVSWNTAANGSGTSYTGGDTIGITTSNVILYAQWTAIDYTVTYNGNTNTGGSVPTDGNTYNITDTVTVLGNTGSLVRTGYTFTGWNTKANGSGSGYNGGDTFAMGSSNVTLYAQWTENTYSVTYNGNSNTGGSVPVDAASYHNGDMATVIGNTGSLVRTGYTFVSWNTAANDSGTSYTGGDTFAMGSSNVTLYAQWSIDAHAPTITAHPQNTAVAVGEQASFTVEYTGFLEPAFQWQLSTNKGKSWRKINGANSDTYTTPAATRKMNGYRYRIIVSDNFASVTSEAATLDVTAVPLAVADISIAKTGIYNPVSNAVTWTITVTNSGPATATGVVVKDILANNSLVFSITTDYNYQIKNKKVIVEIGTLENGSSVEIVIETQLIGALGKVIDNQQVPPFIQGINCMLIKLVPRVVTNTALVTTTSIDFNLANNKATKAITI